MSKYVLEYKLFNCGGYLVLDKNKDYINIVLDPLKANKFKTKKEMKEFFKKYIANNINNIQPVLLDDAKVKFTNALTNGYIVGSMPIKSIYSRPYKNENKYEVLDWWINYHKTDEDSISDDDYQTWPEPFNLFDNIFTVVSYSTDNTNNENLLTFSIKVSKDSDYKTFKKEMDLIVPHITFVDDNGNKVISVFDRFLNQGGDSVNLLLSPNNKYSVVGRCGTEIIKPTSLKKCFEFLRKERYYE